ncbi:MAG: phenylalanine--tRNA ligase subunit alpha [Patescibacteria group bacterium]|jgi:phenylalanyl-tRNA synthetase alpha chain
MNITELKQQALTEIQNANSTQLVEQIRIKFLGRKSGLLTKIIQTLPTLNVDQRKKLGSQSNQVKHEINQALNNKIIALKSKSHQTGEFFDTTLPGIRPEIGHLHPITLVSREVEEIFKSMGFEVHEGAELVTDYYNFESLNIPKDHPARDSQDTFFVNFKPEEKYVMRTQTSAMQVKIMENRKPPLKIVVPGRCFRNESTDASHEHTFYQCEGFIVSEKISVANLICTLKEFLKAYFKKNDVKVRLRPGYFPFVEPGFELDFQCAICGGKGCPVCKQTGWVELIPCGMIHQKVFQFAGYPKNKYTGFAFCIGLTRLAMMKYGINDIRLFMAGDLRFINQF